MLALCVDAVGPFSKSYSSTKTVPSVTGILLSFCLIWVFLHFAHMTLAKNPILIEPVLIQQNVSLLLYSSSLKDYVMKTPVGNVIMFESVQTQMLVFKAEI